MSFVSAVRRRGEQARNRRRASRDARGVERAIHSAGSSTTRNEILAAQHRQFPLGMR